MTLLRKQIPYLSLHRIDQVLWAIQWDFFLNSTFDYFKEKHKQIAIVTHLLPNVFHFKNLLIRNVTTEWFKNIKDHK